MIVRSGCARMHIGIDDLFGADDQPLRGARHLEGETADAVDLGVAVLVGPVDVDQADIQNQGRQQGDRVAGERTLHHLGGAVLEGIGAQHRAHRDEGHAHGGGLEAPGDPGIAPLHAGFHTAALHLPPQAIGNAVNFQPDVGMIQGLDQTCGQQHIQFEDSLPGHPQVVFPCRTISLTRDCGQRTVPYSSVPI